MPHQCTNCSRTFADGSKEMLSGCPNCGGNKFQFRPSGTVDEDELVGNNAEPPDSVDVDEGGFASAAAKAGAAVRDKLPGGRDDEVQTPKTEPSNPDAAPSDTSKPADPATEDTVSSAAPSEVSGSAEASTSPDRSTSSQTSTSSARRVDSAERRRSTTPDEGDQEDSAQAQARSDVVSREELSAEARDVAAESSDAPSEVDSQPDAEPSPDAEPPPDADGTVIEPSSEDRPDLDDLREELNDQFESIKVINPGQYELNLMELYDREEYIISLKEDGRYVIEVPDTWHNDE